jgi:hypothetical protein
MSTYSLSINTLSRRKPSRAFAELGALVPMCIFVANAKVANNQSSFRLA